ncbi:hypothetical protein K490DRAFT_41696 [Saccharata proteae CBS 121410]|uniref:Altered inheritance of mitochondria protein 6 n=1 Tax=Saccharata proteae CBS 121410 TaxID=1314787 RepID=A0A9P4HYJ5_9PEZI|nr:hypothetical protein K490DRAFT_41696 [Saccharata proteae CBS 121410]
MSLSPLAHAAAVPDVSETLQNILRNTHQSDLYHYPTDLTRGIWPKGFHSHNDYWNDVPFYTALSYGAMSTEADVWLVNGTLYVGHEESALTSARTITSLYINPILDTLARQNPTSAFVSAPTRNGVWDTVNDQTLYFFIDMKSDPAGTWPAMLAALEPLRQKNYLTTYNASSGVTTPGPVTVLGSGKTTLADVLAESVRDLFFDGTLADLDDVEGPDVSPVASTGFADNFGHVVEEGMNKTQLATLRDQLAKANAKGIKTRYWDQPGWPIGTRNAIWRTLADEGVDLLNVDDVEGAAGFWENRG